MRRFPLALLTGAALLLGACTRVHQAPVSAPGDTSLLAWTFRSASTPQLHAKGTSMAEDTALGELLAEREYEASDGRGGAPRTVVLRIGRPRPDTRPGGDWVCPFQIIGLGNDDVMAVGGVDAVQALHLAMAMAGARLAHPPRGTTITWLGEADLGLPLPSPAGADPDETEEPDS